MEIQGKPTCVMVRGRTIDREKGKFNKDPQELWTWRVGADRSVPWDHVEQHYRRERERDDRKDVQIVVEFIGREHVSVLTANELSQVLADEPKPQPKIAAYQLPKFVEQYTATIGNAVYGPFGSYDEASAFAHTKLAAHESWSSGKILRPTL